MPTRSFKNTLLLLVLIVSAACSVAQPNDPEEFVVLYGKARQLSGEKKWEKAVPLWLALTEKNGVNGEYWSGLGTACYNARQYEKAVAAYTRQIELGWGIVANAAYNIACCYSLMKNKDQALTWLKRSFDIGFSNLPLAQTDTDLDYIRQEPVYKKLTGTDDVSKMSRIEGWQYDLDLLKQEVMRKVYMRRGLSMDGFNKQFNEIYGSINSKTDVQLILAMMKMMVEVNDGHSALFPPSRKEFQTTLPLQFYLFKEGLYIVASDPKFKHLIGSRVTAFDKKTVEEVSAALSGIISRDNEIGVVQSLPMFMRYTAALHGLGLTQDPGKVELKLVDAAGVSTTVLVTGDTTLPRVDHKSVPERWTTLYQNLSQPVPFYLKNIKATYWFEKLPGSNILYMQWNSVRNDPKESVNAFTDKLFKYVADNNIDKLVIDLRWNNGGNTLLLPYFVNAIIKNETINKRGNLFVITGRRTFSAAQNLATFLERQTNAIFVGEPTGSSPNFVGEEDFIILPYSKVAANVSDLFWQSSWPGDQRTWIAPSIYTPPSFAAYSQNRDEALEAIMKIAANKKLF